MFLGILEDGQSKKKEKSPVLYTIVKIFHNLLYMKMEYLQLSNTYAPSVLTFTR
jgi:hypothetical protein